MHHNSEGSNAAQAMKNELQSAGGQMCHPAPKSKRVQLKVKFIEEDAERHSVQLGTVVKTQVNQRRRPLDAVEHRMSEV